MTVVCGGQAGSEGKGAVTARLHKEREYTWAVRVGGPNAGHTVVGEEGKAYALRQLPVAAVADRGCNLVIAAGSEIDPAVLSEEIITLEANGYPVRQRLFIDREASLIVGRHKEMEKIITTGTTGKGIGAARAERALRAPRFSRVGDVTEMGLHVIDTQGLLQGAVREDDRVMIEGTQGYILGSHAGYFPYCTSGDCRAVDFIAAAGLPPVRPEVWLVLRTHPIRIAGDSGPMAHEVSWEDVGVEPEITTVTKKVRRVGDWDWDWAQASASANRPDAIALTFADYWWPRLEGEDGYRTADDLDKEIWRRLEEIEARLRAPVRMLGTGPDTQILKEV